jgi:hypothetical protein
VGDDLLNAHVAQLVEHVLGKDEVTRSIRVVGSTQLARAASHETVSGERIRHLAFVCGRGDRINSSSM